MLEGDTMNLLSGSQIGAPSPPRNPLPAGATDCHAHVFGPFDRFPLLPKPPYTPPLAPASAYLAMLDAVGFSRGVLVHGSACGWDQGATVAALREGGERLRGVAVVRPGTADTDLDALHAAGIRGLRFTQTAPESTLQPMDGRLGLDDFAPQLRERGWSAHIWAKSDLLAPVASTLASSGVPLVIDHMGFFDTAKGVGDPAFQTLLSLVKEGSAWVKLTAIRNSKAAPGYQDVRPFQEALVAANPERMLWGSDWPYLGMDAARPDVGTLLDLFSDWLGSEALRKQILVTNPAKLFGFK